MEIPDKGSVSPRLKPLVSALVNKGKTNNKMISKRETEVTVFFSDSNFCRKNFLS